MAPLECNSSKAGNNRLNPEIKLILKGSFHFQSLFQQQWIAAFIQIARVWAWLININSIFASVHFIGHSLIHCYSTGERFLSCPAVQGFEFRWLYPLGTSNPSSVQFGNNKFINSLFQIDFRVYRTFNFRSTIFDKQFEFFVANASFSSIYLLQAN